MTPPSAGRAVAISHDRFFLDRICTHMLAFEGGAYVFPESGHFNIAGHPH